MTADSSTQSKTVNALVLAKAILPEIGGIETYSQRVSEAYAEHGYKVTVISCFGGNPGTSRRGEIRLFNVGLGQQWLIAIRMVLAALSLRRRAEQPTFIHATTWRVAIPALLVFPRTPIVLTIHGREVTEAPNLLKPLMRLVCRSVDGCLVISRSTLIAAKRLIPNLGEKSIVSLNGIKPCSIDDYRSARKIRLRHSDCRLLTVCRLVPRKNIHVAIEALAMLHDKGLTDWSYDIVGQGPEFERLVKLSTDLELASKINMPGRVSDKKLVSLYEGSDVFVHPQVSGARGGDIEGFGLVIADAMAWGLAVLVGEAGGPKEFVSDKVTGYVVDGADVSEIASKLQILIQNSELRLSMGDAARDWVTRRLSWAEHIAPITADPTLAAFRLNASKGDKPVFP